MPKLSKRKFDFKTDPIVKLLIALITAILITFMFPRSESIETDYSVGSVWSKEDLIAPFSFPIYKSEQQYQREVNEAKNKVLPLFDENPLKNKGQVNWLESLNRIFNDLKKIVDYENDLNKENTLPEEKRTTSLQTLSKMKSDFKINLNSEEWKGLVSIYLNPSNPAITAETFRKKIIQTLNGVYDKKIINVPKSKFSVKQIAFIKNNIEETVDINTIYGTDDADNILRGEFNNYFKNSIIADVAYKFAKPIIIVDYIYDNDETEKIISAVIDAVPRTFGLVRENERIVSKHDPINELTKLKLESYRRIRAEQLGARDYYLQQLGRFLFVGSMMTLIGIFLYKLREKVFNDNSKLILISTILLLQCLFAYISLQIKSSYPIEYLIFVPVAAMLLTIIFDSRFAFYTIILICVLVSSIRGGDYDILVPNFTASVLVIYSVRDIKKRSQIFVSMIFILLGYAVTIFALGLERYDDMSIVRDQIYVAVLNSILSPILAYGLLIFYEKVFRVATDLVFLELSDFNHPILRELSTKAPGTFHHSIVMGNLSEQAAKEINANQILARVGCYYHDIGKMISPEYFVENQLDSNKHEQLNPSLSAKMIIAHVKNGIKLAERYRVPQEVIDFIPMHHGTNLVSYFFAKAKTEDGNEDVTHDYIYRYPGPKPQTKETGIVMLADAVEAATRAIEDPTPAKIETQIDEIIKARFIEGELDECDLTLKDLIKIKYSFMKTLVGIHHHRIKYPDAEDENSEKKE